MQKSKQRFGSSNGRWEGGTSSDYRRRIMKAKPGEIVHHKDHNKENNAKSNFKIERPSNGMSALGHHNQDHPEKSIAGGLATKRKYEKKG